MPVTTIANKATTQVKIGSGYLRQIIVANAGSAWTLQVNDTGQNQANSAITLLGATPLTIAAGTLLPQPLYFGSGLQIITAGTTAGEMDLDWY